MTVEELRQRMSQREFMDWSAYVAEFGELSPMRMYDRPAALVAYTAQAIQGGSRTMADYMPWPNEDIQEMTGPSLEAGLLAQFGAYPKA